MARHFTTLFFLMLIAEPVDMFDGKWSTPLSNLHLILVNPLPIKISVFEILSLLLAWRSPKKAVDRLVAKGPIPKAIKASLAATVLWALYGLATGGQAKPINQQLHAFVFGLITCLNASAILKTTADFARLGRMVVYAALFRATMGLIFYLYIAPTVPEAEYPAYMTTHHDTMLSVLAIVILVCNWIQTQTRSALRSAMLAGVYLLLAIQLNNRRLAWASLAACLLAVYLMMPKDRVKAQVRSKLLAMSPIVVLYVAVGWGRTEAIFKPLRSFSSMGVGQIDISTLARDNENYSMLVMIQSRPLQGTGWGQEWVEIDSTYGVRLDVFPMYHYVPHNSILALYTFTGALGFFFTWMPLIVGAYVNARLFHRSKVPLDRAAGMTGLCCVIVYMNQMWGDMGMYSGMGGYLLGAGLAAGARLSVTSETWPGLPAPKPARSATAGVG